MTDDGGSVLVCVRVADLPRPEVPSFRDRCGTCGFEVWRSNRSADVGGEVRCVRCAVAEMAPDAEVRMAPYVRADLAERDRLS